jgi:hypothetical protein
MGLWEEKAIFLRLLLRRLLKRQLYRTFTVFLILEGRPAGLAGESVCVCSGRGCLLQIQMAHDVTGKNPETCDKKELFYGSLCNAPRHWLELGRERN